LKQRPGADDEAATRRFAVPGERLGRRNGHSLF